MSMMRKLIPKLRQKPKPRIMGKSRKTTGRKTEKANNPRIQKKTRRKRTRRPKMRKKDLRTMKIP